MKHLLVLCRLRTIASMPSGRRRTSTTVWKTVKHRYQDRCQTTKSSVKPVQLADPQMLQLVTSLHLILPYFTSPHLNSVGLVTGRFISNRHLTLLKIERGSLMAFLYHSVIVSSQTACFFSQRGHCIFVEGSGWSRIIFCKEDAKEPLTSFCLRLSYTPI